MTQHPCDLRLLASRLRAHASGVLTSHGLSNSIRFVISADARIVFPSPVPPERLESPVLNVPDDTDDSIHLLLSDIEPDASIADRLRWEVYHGQTRSVHWATCTMDSARLGPLVVAGDEIPIANPLAGDEPSLCSHANRRPDRLIAAISRFLHIDTANPVVVGVDDAGIHVRARFGILRLDFPAPVHSAADARAAIDRLLEPSI